MNRTPDTTAVGNGGNFDPRQAAALLDQTSQQARRKFEPSPPRLLGTRAVLVLAALGAIWLSVRGQHPYKGPTGADVPILVAFVVINLTATLAVARRATAGIRGRSQLRPAEVTVAVLAWVAVVVVMVALAAAGVSFSLYPTTVLIVPGLAWTALMVARADWRRCGTRARGRRRRSRGRVRRPGRGVGGRRGGPVRRASGQCRRGRVAAARLTVCRDR